MREAMQKTMHYFQTHFNFLKKGGGMKKKKICGYLFIGTLLLVYTVSYGWELPFLNNNYLEKMSEYTNKPDKIKELLKLYYQKNLIDDCPTYELFLNLVVLNPSSIMDFSKGYMIGSQSDSNCGPFYLRYYIILAYYHDKVFFNITHKYIDEYLIHEEEPIVYGGKTSDGSFVTYKLPHSLADLIKIQKQK